MARAKKQGKDSTESLKKRLQLLSRELEIEAALEKVRASAMTMASSTMLAEISAVMFQQIKTLGIDATRCGVGIFDDAHDAMEVWLTTASAGKEVMRVLDYVNLHIHPVYENILAARKKRKPYAITILKGQEIRHYYNTMSAYMASSEKKVFNPEEAFQSFFFDQGAINVTTVKPLSKEEQAIMVRFAKVFGLIYLRFVDLQKAEAQANEARIETSLERVRSRSLAMRKSSELSEVAIMLYKEFRSLGISNFFNYGFVAVDTEEGIQRGWMIQPVGKRIEEFTLPLTGDPVLQERFESWERKDQIFYQSVGGVELKKHLDFVSPKSDSTKSGKAVTWKLPDPTVFYAFNFSHGYLHILSDSLLNTGEELLATRFARVFEIAYRRFLDLKIAEAQAREAQIEAALERIRSKSMAMQRSEEMRDVISAVMDQFHQLGFTVDLANFNFPSRSRDWTMWLARPGYAYPDLIRLPYVDHVLFNNPREAVKKGLDSLSDLLTRQEGKRAMEHFLANSIVGNDPPKVLARIKKAKGLARSMVFGKHIALTISNYEGIPYTADENAILRRFHSVFEQSYTRFLDLQKAEAQTREAQIELALERVRARTMAMHTSEELVETSAVLFHELRSLGVPAIRTGVAVFDRDKETMELWSSQLIEQKQNPILGVVPIGLHPFFDNLFQAWLRNDQEFTFVLAGDEVKKYYQAASAILSYPLQKKYNLREVFNPFFFPEGSLTVVSHEPLNPEERNIMRRFANVFGLLYRRFLDLQKAEAQAREAQIEAALERVRAKTMAMHKSEQLPETAQVLFEQFAVLGSLPDRVSIGIIREEEKVIEWWATDQQGSQLARKFKSTTQQKAHHAWFEAWKQRKESLVIEMTGSDLKEWVRFVRETVNMPMDDSQVKGRRVHHAAFFTHGLLLFSTHEPLPRATLDLLIRFAKVFDQTYTRFLDLQKAEAQAREAQIEASLERVRSSMMAMHQSDGLPEVMKVIAEQLIHLGVRMEAVTFSPVTTDRHFKIWSANVETPYPRQIEIPYLDHPLFHKTRKALEDSVDSLDVILSKEETHRWWRHFFDRSNAGALVTEQRKEYLLNSSSYSLFFAIRKTSILSIANFSGFAFSEEEKSILKRFANVFEQAYARFLEILKAEAQTREAQIEVSLERVRARTMAMHRSAELSEVAVTIHKELIALEVTPFIGCGYVAIDEENKIQHGWTTKPDGSLMDPYHLPLTGEPAMQKRYEAWKRQDPLFCQALGGEDLKLHIEFAFPYLGSKEVEEIVKNFFPDPTIFYCSNFSHGYLTLITGNRITAEEEIVLTRFRKVFEQSYARFLDLQKAEAQAREAQIEAALERVRSRSMAMHKSDELQSVINTVFEQLTGLGVIMEAATVTVRSENDDEAKVWIASKGHTYSQSFNLRPIGNSKIETDITRAYDSGVSYFEFSYGKKDKDQYFSDLFAQTDFKHLPQDRKDFILQSEGYGISAAGGQNSWIQVSSYEGRILSKSEAEVLKRFSAVFEQSYTRFLDLQRAETQAREAQIEAVLEKIRAASMAMHKSEELQVAVNTIIVGLNELAFEVNTAQIVIYKDEPTRGIEYWTASSSNVPYQSAFWVPGLDIPYTKTLHAARENNQNMVYFSYARAQKEEFFTYLFTETNYRNIPEARKKFILESPAAEIVVAIEGDVGVQVIRYLPKPFTREERSILHRLAKVFKQTYTRFLDLQKAEAQAREAQIEAALERVRYHAMAMQTSADVGEATAAVFNELARLGIETFRCGIAICHDEELEVWSMGNTGSGSTVKGVGNLSIHLHPLWTLFYNAWKEKQPLCYSYLTGKEKEEYVKIITSSPTYKLSEDKLEFPDLHFQSCQFEDGGLFTFSVHPQSEEEKKVLARFTNVFALTFRRYKDLQRAEAQAREAQIEAALERVRSRSMAMHKSEELLQVVAALKERLIEVGLNADATRIMTFKPEENITEIWISNQDYSYSQKLIAPYSLAGGKVGHEFNENLRSKTAYSKSYSKVEKDVYWHYMFEKSDFRKINPERKQFILDANYYNIGVAFEGQAALFLARYSDDKFTVAEIEILKRFTKVFEQSYTRFLDLQKAEAQAREAQIEASLERVRSSMMAMHQSDGLPEVMKVIADQLIHLGVRMEAVSFLPVTTSKDLKFWGANVEKPYPIQIEVPYLDHPTFNKTRKAIDDGVDSFDILLTKEETQRWWRHFFDNSNAGALVSQERKEYLLNTTSYGLYARRKTSILSIANFSGLAFSEEEHNILKRFANVFEQAYTRFLDIQKAEAQAREAQIEASLERLRSKTMAMHNSNEVGESVACMFAEFVHLGISTNRCGILIFKDETLAEVWTAKANTEETSSLIIGSLDLRLHPLTRSAYEAKVAGESFHQYCLMGDDLVQYYQSINAQRDYAARFDLATLPEKEYHSDFYFADGAVFAFTNEPLADEHSILFKRFAGVFGQTYRRYLDLQKAEAQAREAQIEASLERVRSRSLAMHRSSEMQEVVAVVFRQLLQLGVNYEVVTIATRVDHSNDLLIWVANEQNSYSNRVHLPYTDFGPGLDLIEAMDKKEPFYSKVYSFEEKNRWWMHAFEHSDFRHIPEVRKHYILDAPVIAMSAAIVNNIAFQLIDYSGKITTEQEVEVVKRFAWVFEQCYVRFKDLEKAEVQAREATIQASLERVRSKAMAMHNSEDLSVTVDSFFAELRSLGVTPRRCGVTLIDQETRIADLTATTATAEGESRKITGKLKLSGHPVLDQVYDHWSQQKEYHPVLRGKEIAEYYGVMNPQVAYPQFATDEVQYGHYFFFKEGGVYAWTENEMPDEALDIYRRFTSVLSLTYRRYKDLKDAEAQAREATIQASLERVRAKAMAMHSSQDLAETIHTFYSELVSMNLTPRRAGLGLINKETRVAEISTMNTTEAGISVEVIGEMILENHPVLEGVYDHWLRQAEYHPVLRGNEIKEYYQLLRKNLAFPDYPNDAVQFGYFFFFEEGGVYAWTEKQLQEDELNIYRRFTSVLSLTYKRYKDLKDAEARAKEAVKQASLDRVRAEIASMRNAEDLQRITPLMWRELKTLGVPFFRCGVLIVNEQDQKADYYLSTPEGRPLAALHLDFNTNIQVVQNALEHWRQQKVYIDHWSKEQFVAFARSMMELGQIQTMKSYQGGEEPPVSITLQFVPFTQGMLYVGSSDALSADQLEIVHALADAFSTAYARYEDFTRLEAAKATVERALSELRTTQNQLVQSEKMASLGELTAGIAHEIQNPLNFVNNFSEVSKELLDEMEEELKKGNNEDALQIAKDIINNLEKINFHGKRADGIVKSMLQHSRKSTGQKELTDINALCDEYLRLSYHGLRAKDKSFNAKFETNFDPSVGQISVLPQEIGRVILNLINNAFYAVSEKKKLNLDAYEPTVTVTTKKEGNKIEIQVKDNGTGIPQNVVDKIFNPFFTTKPTGQGTGLGLSLSYDIVKAHGGDLTVETGEGAGSVFTILLNAS